MAGQVYAVASGKGGVGKTTTVVNLGVVLRRADHTVALVDADLGMANLGTMLGIDGEATLHDVLAGDANLEEAIIEEAEGFAVITGSTDLSAYPAADPSELGPVLEALAEEYEFVLVDTGAGMSWEDVLPLGLADRIVLVTSPEPAATGDTKKTAELAELAEGHLAGLVVTMADDTTDARYVGSQVGVDVIGVIPFDPAVRESTASATPLEGLDPDTPAAVAYRDLATTLTGGAVEPPTRGPEAEASAASETEPADSRADAAAAAAELGGADVGDEQSADSTETEPDGSGGVSESAAIAEPDEGATTPSEADADDGDDEEPADVAAEEDEEPIDEEELDEYLKEFEDDQPQSSGGLLARLGRLFR